MSTFKSRRVLSASTTIAALSLALAACGGGSSADGDTAAGETYDLQYSTFTGPNNPTQEAFEWWIDEVEARTDGRVKVEPFYSEALLAGADTLQGLQDGRTDLATVGGSFSPENFLSQVVAVPFVTTNAEAQMRAFNDLYAENEDFRNEWESKNAHVLMFPPNTPNIIGTKKMIDSLDDLKGLQIRASGFISNALNAIGANAIALPSPEIYESVERGVIDGYSGFTFDYVVDFKLNEVAPFITNSGLGNYVVAPIVIRQDLWDEMPEDIQQVLTEVSNEYMDEVTTRLIDLETSICDEVLDGGGTVSIMPEAEVDKWKEAIGTDIYDLWAETVPDGVDPDAFFEQYTGLIQKYEDQVDYTPGVDKCAERS